MNISRALYFVAIALVAVWALNFVVWHAGTIINLLLIVALGLVIYNLVTGRRRV